MPDARLGILMVVMVTQYDDDRNADAGQHLGGRARFLDEPVLRQVACDQEHVGATRDVGKIGNEARRPAGPQVYVPDGGDAYHQPIRSLRGPCAGSLTCKRFSMGMPSV